LIKKEEYDEKVFFHSVSGCLDAFFHCWTNPG
jgi:hypothetical protein